MQIPDDSCFYYFEEIQDNDPITYNDYAEYRGRQMHSIPLWEDVFEILLNSEIDSVLDSYFKVGGMCGVLPEHISTEGKVFELSSGKYYLPPNTHIGWFKENGERVLILINPDSVLRVIESQEDMDKVVEVLYI